jgi:hypothetical protein
MSFTAFKSPDDRTAGTPHYGLVNDTEVAPDDVHEKCAKRPRSFVGRGASATIFAMTAPYVLGTSSTPP